METSPQSHAETIAQLTQRQEQLEARVERLEAEVRMLADRVAEDELAVVERVEAG